MRPDRAVVLARPKSFRPSATSAQYDGPAGVMRPRIQMEGGKG